MIRAAMNFSELFEKAHPGLTVVVEPGSSRSAVNGVRAGKLDIGLVGHAIPPRDRNGLSIVPIKKEAILLVTYPANPVASLSLAQIRGVYRGEISNWARLGGEAQAIVPFTRWQNSMIRRIFLRIAFGNEAGIQEKAFRIPKDKVLRTIKKIQGSLGYTPTTLEVARGSDVKILAVDGHEPTRQNVQRGAYPFSRTMVVISADAPNAILLDWMNGFAKFVQEESEARQR
jgi:phosphate transport system substrate-binding protein